MTSRGVCVNIGELRARREDRPTGVFEEEYYGQSLNCTLHYVYLSMYVARLAIWYLLLKQIGVPKLEHLAQRCN